MAGWDARLYVPTNMHAVPWDEIEQFYNELTECALNQQPMVDIVRHISANYEANRFYGATTMHTLVVGISNPIDRQREALHIDFHSDRDILEFRYFSKPSGIAEFTRTYDSHVGSQKFDQFVRMIRW